MKRQSLLFAFALIFVVGAALWGVNGWRNRRIYQLPLTAADVKFQDLVRKADTVWVEQNDIEFPFGHTTFAILKGEQYHEFMRRLRFARSTRQRSEFYKYSGTALSLKFFHNGYKVTDLTLWQTSMSSVLTDPMGRSQDYDIQVYELEPLFEKPLNYSLDQIAPQRRRP